MLMLVPQNQNTLIYDSNCNLCMRIIRFLKWYERKPSMTFVSNNSEIARDLAKAYGLELDSLKSVILNCNGRVYSKSTAALKAANYLRGGWQLLSLFLLFPRPVRDCVYEVIARNRYRWFGQCQSCVL